MKENELRIGNWVRHCAAWSYRQDADDFEEFNFQWQLEDFYALCECTLDIDNVEYIPLTEEWLLKFGFVKVKDDIFRLLEDDIIICTVSKIGSDEFGYEQLKIRNLFIQKSINLYI
jgi:hypothetical protein